MGFLRKTKNVVELKHYRCLGFFCVNNLVFQFYCTYGHKHYTFYCIVGLYNFF